MNSEFSIALHCLLLLADQPNMIATSNEIAHRACVHPVRIRKILGILRREGYIRSKEGAGGGFYLASDPCQVTLDEIYRLTSIGTLRPKCPTSNKDCIISANFKETLHNIFYQAESQVELFLKQYTIRDVLHLVKSQKR